MPISSDDDATVVGQRDRFHTIAFESPYGEVDYIAAPAGWFFARTLTRDGAYYEHSDTDPDGCWIYRQSPA